jgi:hypothetical protein
VCLLCEQRAGPRQIVLDERYSTFLGGSNCNQNSVGCAVAVNSAEEAFVAGNTFDDTFPTLDPLFPSFTGSGNAVFASEFNAAGSGLLFSTLLGNRRRRYRPRHPRR